MPEVKIPLARHDITEEDIARAVEALKSPFLTRGPMLYEFEKTIARYVGTQHAIAASSGTAALHMSLLALGVGPGDIVITTPLSFIASSNVIMHAGAVPVFVDVEPFTYQIDPAQVEKKIQELRAAGERPKAILAVDLFGYIADWSELRHIAEQYHLVLIEDSCEALGSYFDFVGTRHMAGSFGDVGVFGFFPNKQVVTGEGGMLVTDSDEVNHLARMLKNHGAHPDNRWDEYEVLGYNYHLTETSAALGISQMRRIETIVQRRAEISAMYDQRLLLCKDVVLPIVLPFLRISRFVYVIQLSEYFISADRNNLERYMLEEHGVLTRKYFPCIHLSPFYRRTFGYKPGTFPIAEGFSDRSIALPFFHGITEEQIDYVVDALHKGIRFIRGAS